MIFAIGQPGDLKKVAQCQRCRKLANDWRSFTRWNRSGSITSSPHDFHIRRFCDRHDCRRTRCCYRAVEGSAKKGVRTGTPKRQIKISQGVLMVFRLNAAICGAVMTLAFSSVAVAQSENDAVHSNDDL